MQVKIIVADTETTGLRKPPPPATGVVQVAYLEIDANLNILKVFNELVDPGCPIEGPAEAVHGISDDMVFGKPKLAEVFHIAEPVLFIAHNAKFDLPRLAEGMDNCVDVLCTLEAARKYLKGQPNNKLLTLIRHFGLEEHQAHDALGDVRMALSVLKLLLETTGFTLQELVERTKVPIVPTTINFGRHAGKSLKDLPTQYIDWLLALTDLNAGLRKGLELQLTMRGR